MIVLTQTAIDRLVEQVKESDMDDFIAMFDHAFGTESRFNAEEDTLEIVPGEGYGGVLKEMDSVDGKEPEECAPYLSKRDMDRIKEVLDTLEVKTYFDTGIKHISGGFANAEMTNYDEDWVYIELRWGVQNDVTNEVHTEEYKLLLTEIRLYHDEWDVLKAYESLKD